jgi:hypothetical protein
MIANQLNATPDNKLETILPSVPENTTVYKFNGSGYTSYNFSADNPGWFPAGGTLNPGEGAFVRVDPASIAPATTTTFTLVGEVKLSSATPVANNYSIISSVIPQSDTLDNMGFPSRENDNVYFFNPASGAYTTYNFSADNPGWFPPNPTPAVGQSFFFRGDGSQGPNRTWNRVFSVGP